ncbi:MAG: plasmid pRiA4b ORF-3 family protein [Mediterranea sp.]|jgi:hypothetical protein|nr:plasmid pRiA4b ORF-3 family protein [Mediterranea sp.]
MLYQFKIKLNGITHPPVWRRVLVPSTFTFHKFHAVIQAAFGWEDYHLYEFKDKEYDSAFSIGIPMEEDSWFAEKRIDARKNKLSQVFGTMKKIVYIYDFGDDWVHEVVLEGISPQKGTKAVCLAGKGACPPEDCGGIFGYIDIKEAFEKDPKGEEANEYREWLNLDDDEDWDPKRFDIKWTNDALVKI